MICFVFYPKICAAMATVKFTNKLETQFGVIRNNSAAAFKTLDTTRDLVCYKTSEWTN